jgi:hypothetical protein
MFPALLCPTGEVMRTSWFWASVVVLATCATSAPAQTYTIKLKADPDAGNSIFIREAEKNSGTIKVFDAADNLLKEDRPGPMEKAYTLTILERGAGSEMQKYLRAYDKATETKGDKTKVFSYQGRTVVFERKKDKYWVGVVGQPPLDPADLEKLIQKANDRGPDMDKVMAPPAPVAVGDSWKPDLKLWAEQSKQFDFELKDSKAEVKLLKVYTKGKSRFGILEFSMNLAVKGFGPGMPPFDRPIPMEMRGTLDAAIDGSSPAGTLNLTIEMKGKAVLQGKDAKVKIEIDMVGLLRAERSEQVKAKVQDLPAVELAGPGPAWVPFSSKPGRFSARFPGKPGEDTKKDAKNNTTTNVMATLENGQILYQVSYTDFAADISKVDPKVLLGGVVNNLGKEKIKNKRDIEINGFPGVELVLEFEHMSTKLRFMHRTFMVNGRLYQILVGGDVSMKDMFQADRFLSSFELHEKAAPLLKI